MLLRTIGGYGKDAFGRIADASRHLSTTNDPGAAGRRALDGMVPQRCREDSRRFRWGQTQTKTDVEEMRFHHWHDPMPSDLGSQPIKPVPSISAASDGGMSVAARL